MKKLLYNNTFFLKSSDSFKDWVNYSSIEFVFTGYTNVGKSSTINSLTNKKKLSFFSKKPGCTKLINFFQINNNFRIVDLPGYGYSKVSREMKKKINHNIFYYLNNRSCLGGIVLLSNIKFPLKKIDIEVLRISQKRSIFLIILLTKSDTISQKKRLIQLKYTQNLLKDLKINTNIFLFSNYQKQGIQDLKKTLSCWKNFFEKK